MSEKLLNLIKPGFTFISKKGAHVEVYGISKYYVFASFDESIHYCEKLLTIEEFIERIPEEYYNENYNEN